MPSLMNFTLKLKRRPMRRPVSLRYGGCGALGGSAEGGKGRGYRGGISELFRFRQPRLLSRLEGGEIGGLDGGRRGVVGEPVDTHDDQLAGLLALLELPG